MIVQDQGQKAQRVKVGMIGLAAVLLLILLAAAVFSTASRERPVVVAGGAHPDVVANLVTLNQAEPGPAPTNEPLAEMGVAPSTVNDAPSNTATAQTTTRAVPNAPRR